MEGNIKVSVMIQMINKRWIGVSDLKNEILILGSTMGNDNSPALFLRLQVVPLSSNSGTQS